MKFITTDLPGVVIVEPNVPEDTRGWFMETYHRQRFATAGLEAEFVQDNHSRSSRGTLRGLHFQHPHGQIKLLRAVRGEIFDACVDVRQGSPTFGRAFWTTLSEENRRQLWVPSGFAHGFCVVSESADLVYKASDFYSPADERGISWDDPALGIPWPVERPLLSARDGQWSRLAEAEGLPRFDG